MRAILQTVSAVVLGVASLTPDSGARADTLSLMYSDGHYGHPAYSVSYRHGPACYTPYYRAPRHVHHYHHYDGHDKHSKHGKHHSYGGHRDHDYRGHDRHSHGGRHGYRDDRRSGYGGHGDGGRPQRTHTAYARH